MPEKGLQAEREKALEEKLEAYRKSLSPEELQSLVQKTKALEAYQEEEEETETLSCIPMLKREDIKKEAAHLTNEELDLEEVSSYITMYAQMGLAILISFLSLERLQEKKLTIWDF